MKNLKNTRRSFYALIIAAAILVPSTVWANAFFIQEMSGDGMAQGAAVVAGGNKPSSLFQNAANLSFLDGLWLEAASTIYIPWGYFENPQGEKTHLGSSPIVTPHFFGSYKINDWLAVGLGGFVDFGLSITWPDDWEGSHLVKSAGMNSFTINPNVSFGPFKGFAIAAGFDAKYGSVSVKRKLTLGMSPIGEENAANTLSLGGSAWGFGANIGVMYQPAKWVRMGAAYRSQIKMAMKGGKADFDVISPFAASFPDQNFDANITLPNLISMGARFWIMDNLSVELDLWVTMWSSYNELRFDFDKGLRDAPNHVTKTQVEKQDFYDFIQVRLGAEWRFHEHFALRGGFMLDGGVIPDKTLGPMLPDNNRLNTCVGIGTNWGGFNVDLAYMLVYMLPRDVRGVKDNPLPGKYTFMVHDLTLSVAYNFDFGPGDGGKK